MSNKTEPVDYRKKFEAIKAALKSQAAADVLMERNRQIAHEGRTPEGDDELTHAELSRAAYCYTLHASVHTRMEDNPSNRETNGAINDIPPADWSLPPDAWKPKTVRRDLVRAGALILAEIERLDREAERKGESCD